MALKKVQDTTSFFSPSYLEHLNSVQRQAVEHLGSPLLVLAGAGTGKTRVLTTRLVHLLHTQSLLPTEVLAVTFTNKAASEMKDRIESLRERSSFGLWVGTFHSIAVRILRQHAGLVGLTPYFTILDTADQLRLIKQLLKDHDHLTSHDLSPKVFLHQIGMAKDRNLQMDQIESYFDWRVSKLARLYQEELLRLNAVDFSDLLLHNLSIFRQYPDLLSLYQHQFKHILVDEYQDTNTAQYIWLRLLAAGSQNICCVGDDDQSIYGWRGAEVGNILRFGTDFPGAKIIRLEQNYRSTTPILKAANALIACNQSRYQKTLWTERDKGDPVTIQAYYDGEQEAIGIAHELEKLYSHHNTLESVAILVRASYQTRAFEECFIQFGIAYKVIGGLRFYERQEIRDCLAYLRLLIQPNDMLAFERVINTPKRGLGETSLKKLRELGKDEGLSYVQVIRDHLEKHTSDDVLTLRVKKILQNFFQDLERWCALLDTQTPADLAKIVLEESGYIDALKKEQSLEAESRLENIKEFIDALKTYETISEFLDHVSLVLDKITSSTEDTVMLMTLHAAKGLEFDTVFLPGWEEGLFPHARSFSEGPDALEEERRLAYVGLSRARNRAFISYAYRRQSPQGWQSTHPSRFVKEIPSCYTKHYGVNGMLMGHDQQNEMSPAWPSRSYDFKKTQSQPKLFETPKKQQVFKTGQRVLHEKFGIGSVLAFEGDKLLIDFDTVGLKKIIASFVNNLE